MREGRCVNANILFVKLMVKREWWSGVSVCARERDRSGEERNILGRSKMMHGYFEEREGKGSVIGDINDKIRDREVENTIGNFEVPDMNENRRKLLDLQ